MIDLHRHDEFSNFDGMGKPMYLATLAKELGHSALSTTNHGTTAGLAETYFACREVGIKAILGVEAYFQPKFDAEKKEKKRNHLCLFAKNLQGYKNLNRIMTIANLEQKYYYPIVDFALLKEYREGIICTSACIGGHAPRLIADGEFELAKKSLIYFKKIFGEDFYVEIQPYKLSEEWLQERVNKKMMQFADELEIKCILTSDSHYGKKSDLPTYLKMHEMAGRDSAKISKTYKERYMPTDGELQTRFYNMHSKNSEFPIKNNISRGKEMLANIEELGNKCEPDILAQLPLVLPKAIDGDSIAHFRKEIIKGLKSKGKHTQEYIDRCKKEAKVIEGLGFADYFLIVQDYVLETKRRGIAIGPGRGSVCNCLVAYAMGITNIDSIYFNLDFDRFMREDKKKVPDIDLDFETTRRHEVIEYMVEKYKGYSAQVISYGLYKADNLLNDLFKVCGVESAEDKGGIKKFVKANIEEENFVYSDLKNNAECRMWNKQFDDIILHFSVLYKQVKYFGTHAAGIAITGSNLLDYVALERRKDKIVTAYDLGNLELINVVKFDILGLRTLSPIKELQELTGEYFNYSWCEDRKIMRAFGEGRTNGIFQFESKGAQEILRIIGTDCAEDVLAGSALNRPGPLSLGMHTQYGSNKENLDDVAKSPWYQYSKETYGTIVYQEQIVRICRKIGRFEWSEVDRILKVLKGRGRAIKFRDKEIAELKVIFFRGAKAGGYSKEEADRIFEILLIYSFNKGHAAGYGVISIEQMYYKVYYPELFWYVTLKYANEKDKFRFEIEAVQQGSIILLPHVNYGAEYKVAKVEGEDTIAAGLSTIKGVGEKAATIIEAEKIKNGRYTSLENFIERVPKRIVNVKVVRILKEWGALEFDKKTYFNRVKKYNSTLYQRGINNS